MAKKQDNKASRSSKPAYSGKSKGAAYRGSDKSGFSRDQKPRGKQPYAGGYGASKGDDRPDKRSSKRGPSNNKGRGRGGAYNKDSRTGADIIAGKHAVIEALEADVPISSILLAQGSQGGDAIDKVMRLAERKGVSVDTVPRSKIEEKAADLNHQGIVAMARPYEYSSVGEMMSACEGEESALVIVLDHITDVGNFGAIVRTAEVLGATGVVIPNKRSVDVVSSSYKTSAGAVSRMKIAKVSNIPSSCERLKENGFWIAGASEKAEADCWDTPMGGKLALVMGSEEDGISRVVQQKCDFMVRLPQRGEIGSLNVSCATSALGYEWMRQSRIKAADGTLEDNAGE